MTDQLLRFADLIAWSTLAFVALRVLLLFGITMFEPHTNDATIERRATLLARSTWLVFLAASWLCAGRFA
jgi:hypothetical protein